MLSTFRYRVARELQDLFSSRGGTIYETIKQRISTESDPKLVQNAVQVWTNELFELIGAAPIEEIRDADPELAELLERIGNLERKAT